MMLRPRLPHFVGFVIIAAIMALASAPAATLLVKSATFLTMKHGQEQPFTGYLRVGKDGKLTTIGEGAPLAGICLATASTAFRAK